MRITYQTIKLAKSFACCLLRNNLMLLLFLRLNSLQSHSRIFARKFNRPRNQKQRLRFFFIRKLIFSFFLEKTGALEQIYEELCQLFDVSPKQEPIKIVKVESGSLWLWLNGNPKVVSAVSSVIEKAARYFYRNYTDEGKLSAIRKKVETIESVLHLSDELKKRDITTDKLDDHIKKASITIGNNLEKLLAGEDRVELNGEVIALTPNVQQNLIGNKQVRLIEGRKPE